MAIVAPLYGLQKTQNPLARGGFVAPIGCVQTRADMLKPTNSELGCQVCGNSNGDCRTNGTGLFICSKEIHAEGSKVNGLISRGATKGARHCGIWYQPAESQGVSVSTRIPRKKKQEPVDAEIASGLTAEARDSNYSRILGELTLHPADLSDLSTRGFTREQIDLIGFRSVTRYQPLTGSYNRRLPGLSKNGKSLSVAEDGYLCPIRDSQGLIVGCQLRVRGASKNKYRNLSANGSQKMPDSGEYPLSVYYPRRSSKKKRILLCEGTGPKPALLSERFGLPTVGMFGGLFSGSPLTLKKTLSEISAKLGSKAACFVPDANSLANASVRQRDSDTCDLLRDLGYRVEVAYWGQGWAKSRDDGDELPRHRSGEIQYISPAQYFQLELSRAEAASIKIQELLDRNLSPERRARGKAQIQLDCGLGGNAFEEIWGAAVLGREEEAVAEEIAQAAAKARPSSANTLNIEDFLPPHIAQPIEYHARLLGTNTEPILFSILAAIASLIHLDTKLDAMPGGNLYAKAILYVCVVGESGWAKSPCQKIAISPLMAIQSLADEKYDYELEVWEGLSPQLQKKKPKPFPREYWVDDATKEANAAIQKNQPNHGFLNFCDELSSLWARRGQYAGGRGDDKEKMLSGKDGGALKSNRADGKKRVSVPRSGMSIAGGTQPKTLSSMMDLNDPAGEWARFLMVLMRRKRRVFSRGKKVDTLRLLQTIYQDVMHLQPRTYEFSPEASLLYEQWFGWLDEKSMSDRRGAFRSIWSKAQSETASLALILHVLNSAIRTGQALPSRYVEIGTLRNAIKLVKFSVSQMELIHSQGTEIAGQEILSAIIQLSLDTGGWINARETKNAVASLRSDKSVKASHIREMFFRLAELGHGEVQGSKSRVSFKAKGAKAIADDPGEWVEPVSGAYRDPVSVMGGLGAWIQALESSGPDTFEAEFSGLVSPHELEKVLVSVQSVNPSLAAKVRSWKGYERVAKTETIEAKEKCRI